MRRNPVEISQLIGRQPQRREDLRVKLVERALAGNRDSLVQPRAPAQYAHYQLGRKPAIGPAQVFQPPGVQQFVGIRILTIHSQQDVECSHACRRDWHKQKLLQNRARPLAITENDFLRLTGNVPLQPKCSGDFFQGGKEFRVRIRKEELASQYSSEGAPMAHYGMLRDYRFSDDVDDIRGANLY